MRTGLSPSSPGPSGLCRPPRHRPGPVPVHQAVRTPASWSVIGSPPGPPVDNSSSRPRYPQVFPQAVDFAPPKSTGTRRYPQAPAEPVDICCGDQCDICHALYRSRTGAVAMLSRAAMSRAKSDAYGFRGLRWSTIPDRIAASCSDRARLAAANAASRRARRARITCRPRRHRPNRAGSSKGGGASRRAARRADPQGRKAPRSASPLSRWASDRRP